MTGPVNEADADQSHPETDRDDEGDLDLSQYPALLLARRQLFETRRDAEFDYALKGVLDLIDLWVS